MSRKKLFRITLVMGICLVLGISMSTTCFAAKYTINAISAWPKTTFMVQNFTRFIDRVNAKAAKEYPGQLEIKYKGGPEVISFKEQVEAVRTGIIDMVFTATSYYTSIIPVGDGFSASKLKPWEEREMGVFDFINGIHEEKANAFFLSRMGSGIPFQIFLNKKVSTVADLKGMKLRCSPTLVPFLKKIKANPVVMKPGDIYTALERGVVDGYIWPAAQIREWGWEKVTKYVLEPPLPYQAIDVVLVNLDAWKKLPIELQGLLVSSAKDDEFRTVVRALEYMPRENAGLAKVGLKFIKMSDAETQKLQNAAIEALWEVLMKRDAANAKKLKGMISK